MKVLRKAVPNPCNENSLNELNNVQRQLEYIEKNIKIQNQISESLKAQGIDYRPSNMDQLLKSSYEGQYHKLVDKVNANLNKTVQNYQQYNNIQRNQTVIGKITDLNNLKPCEETLLNDFPNQGSPKLNWKYNSRLLRTEMNRGYPIRDASVNLKTGELIRYPNSFLEMERNLLVNHGWIYNSGINLWMPPF